MGIVGLVNRDSDRPHTGRERHLASHSLLTAHPWSRQPHASLLSHHYSPDFQTQRVNSALKTPDLCCHWSNIHDIYIHNNKINQLGSQPTGSQFGHDSINFSTLNYLEFNYLIIWLLCEASHALIKEDRYLHYTKFMAKTYLARDLERRLQQAT